MYGCMNGWPSGIRPRELENMDGHKTTAVFVSVHLPSFPQISSFFRQRGEERSNERVRGGSELYAAKCQGCVHRQGSARLCTLHSNCNKETAMD